LNSTINIRAGRGPMDSILTDHRILTQKENPAFYDSMSTCHVNPARHADAIWLERLHLDKETAKCFQEKFHAYNKATMGQSKILPAERHRFVNHTSTTANSTCPMPTTQSPTMSCPRLIVDHYLREDIPWTKRTNGVYDIAQAHGVPQCQLRASTH